MKGHDGRTTLPTTTTTVLEIPSQDRPRYKSRFANYQTVSLFYQPPFFIIDQCAMKGHDGRTTLPTTTTTVLEIPSQDRPRYKSRFANYQALAFLACCALVSHNEL